MEEAYLTTHGMVFNNLPPQEINSLGQSRHAHQTGIGIHGEEY
jgi:hypothetical protein